MSLFQNRSFSNAMWQSTTHVSAFQELASRSRSGRIGEDKIQSGVSARRRQTADGMPGRFSGRNLPLSGQWRMPPTHAIDARHTLEKLQQTRSSVFFQNVAVVHRAHRALEKAEIASSAEEHFERSCPRSLKRRGPPRLKTTRQTSG